MHLNLRMPWMTSSPHRSGTPRRWRTLPQRRISSVDHLRPQRWNWSLLTQPLDQRVEKQSHEPLGAEQVVGLRFFWLDGLFSAISENFYLNFIPLFALAYGASNGEVGWITSIGNLCGALALFPGARLVGSLGQRKPLIVWTGGGAARFALLLMALIPFVAALPSMAIIAIIVFNGLRAFMSNFANPAWTSMVADLVPPGMRGRYLSSRNFAMGVAALCVAPVAGWLIQNGNGWRGMDLLGFQSVFLLAFLFGVIGTLNFRRIPEPKSTISKIDASQRGNLFQTVGKSPGFLGLVLSAFIWNLAIQVAGPFFNVYLVDNLGGSMATVGVMASVSSLFALMGQMRFGQWMDSRGAVWVQLVSGLFICILPFGWMLVTEPWQVVFINILGGFMWAGFNLANFNLLLELTPDSQRAQAVALFQFMVFGSAFIGPLLGGYLADAVGFRLIFGISSGGRILGMLVFAVLVARQALRAGKGGPAALETVASS